MRSPLTDDELKQVKASDLVRLKLAPDEVVRLREINKLRDDERLARAARLRLEAEPILADLRKVGLDVGSVWDLVNTSTPYPKAISVLLRHLQLPYHDRNIEGIARALAVRTPEVQRAWPLLLEQYRKASMGLGFVAPGDTETLKLGAKDGLACALLAAVTDSTLEQLIGLVKDPSQGPSRVLLLSALRKRRSSLVQQTLAELASDPDFAAEISSWRRGQAGA